MEIIAFTHDAHEMVFDPGYFSASPPGQDTHVLVESWEFFRRSHL